MIGLVTIENAVYDDLILLILTEIDGTLIESFIGNYVISQE